jgi:cytochrome c
VRLLTILLFVMFLAPQPCGAADVTAGQAVFNRCKICHSLEAGKNMVGPSLHGLFGRKAGSVDNYTYSAATKDSGVVWDDDTLTKYLRDPKAFIPGDKMAFPGIKDDGQIADLLAYLHQATQ